MPQNCWEIMKCGREPGGDHPELGVCPAAVGTRLDGVHRGKNGGRACWVVAGTFCRGEIQGTFAKKLETCLLCPVYKQISNEEEENFLSVFQLEGKLT